MVPPPLWCLQMTRARLLLMQYLLRRMRRRAPKIYRLLSLLWNLRAHNLPDDAAARCELERRLRECKAKNSKRAARRQRGREKKIEASQPSDGANKAAPDAGLPTLSSLPSVGAAAVPPKEAPLVPTHTRSTVLESARLDTGRSVLDSARSISFRSVETPSAAAESDKSSAEGVMAFPSIINAPVGKRVAELQLPPQSSAAGKARAPSPVAELQLLPAAGTAARASSPGASSPRPRQAPPTSVRRDASPRGASPRAGESSNGPSSESIGGSFSKAKQAGQPSSAAASTPAGGGSSCGTPAAAPEVEGGRSKSWETVGKAAAQVGTVATVVKTVHVEVAKSQLAEAAVPDSAASLEAAASEFVRKADAESQKLSAGNKPLATRLGEVLIAKKITVHELVATWAKGPHSEPISKME